MIVKNLFICTLLVGSLAFSQNKKPEEVSIDAIMSETQFVSDRTDAMEMIWWIPFEFWEVTGVQDPATSQDDINAMKELFEGIEIFAIVKGNIGYFGGVTYMPLSEILKEFEVTYKGEILTLLEPLEISPDLLNFASMMTPMMSNLFGEMGKNMHFVFMTKDSSNETFSIDALGNGKINIALGDFEKVIQLPLSSLLLEKKCIKEGELYSGKWNFCPIHGSKLIEQ